MTNVPALLRRELNAYFASVLGYVVLMFFLVVMGVTFGVVVRYLNTRADAVYGHEDPVQHVLAAVAGGRADDHHAIAGGGETRRARWRC